MASELECPVRTRQQGDRLITVLSAEYVVLRTVPSIASKVRPNHLKSFTNSLPPGDCDPTRFKSSTSGNGSLIRHSFRPNLSLSLPPPIWGLFYFDLFYFNYFNYILPGRWGGTLLYLKLSPLLFDETYLFTQLRAPFSLLWYHLPPQKDLFTMNSNFNLNNEVDETMQWPGPPGSITSSEGFTGTDNDRVCSHPETTASRH